MLQLIFFELVVTAHILAAAMHYFGLDSQEGHPTQNMIAPSDGSSKWLTLKRAAEQIVDNYVMVHELNPNCESTASVNSNPHADRVASEHSYALIEPSHGSMKRKRKLPQWLMHTPPVSTNVKQQSPDGVFNYASAVLKDGLLLLELRDSIREGDGPRVIRCWKFMLLHWRHARHTKYSLEVLHLIAAIHSTASERIAHELIWCRFINTRGVPGGNIPIDLFMEHLNRTLKDYLMGLGANISESTICQTSKSLRNLMDISAHFDYICNIPRQSIYHTSQCYGRDLDLILEELTSKSHVFDYVPGRAHRSFPTIKPHISQHIDIDKLFVWINKHKAKLANQVKLRNILHGNH